jgi:DNA-binding transcriptional regulator YiaG
MTAGWTGRDACVLQAALRMSHQEFAAHLKVGLRTVGDWHEKPDSQPNPGSQRRLDTALREAPPEPSVKLS